MALGEMIVLSPSDIDVMNSAVAVDNVRVKMSTVLPPS